MVSRPNDSFQFFRIEIDPQTPAKDLSHAAIARLYDKVKFVLQQGLKYKGATDRDSAYRWC